MECKVGRATVRIHGEPNRERIEAATQKFLKKTVEQKKRSARRSEENRIHSEPSHRMGGE